MTDPDALTSEPWPVLVVSLPDATERRRRIAAQLASLGIPFEIVDAVDGRKGLAAEHEARIDRAATAVNLGRPMTDAEYGCALSHLAIYRDIVTRNLPGAIVLEDDAIIGPRFAEFRRVRGHDQAALVQLDHSHGRIWRFSRRVSLTDGIRLAKTPLNASLTTGYSISRAGALHILGHATPLRGLADWPCDVTVLPTMLALPPVVGHPPLAESASTINAERAAAVSTLREKGRSGRFLGADYWRRWWIKRRTTRVS